MFRMDRSVVSSDRFPWPLAVALVFALATATVSLAHDTWIAPRGHSARVGATVVVDMTSGMTFPELDYAIKTERVRESRVRLGGTTADVTDRRAGAKSLELSFEAGREGVATVWVDLAPKSLVLDAAEVAHYLEEIGAADTVGREWNSRKGRKRWRETYTKHAKTFVLVGEASKDRSWVDPVGMLLEIVPESDPTSLRVGDTMTVRVLKDGRPLEGFAIAAVPAGAKTGELRRTDRAGRVAFVLDRAGGWLLRGTDLYASPTRRGEWESHFTTLTVEVVGR